MTGSKKGRKRISVVHYSHITKAFAYNFTGMEEGVLVKRGIDLKDSVLNNALAGYDVVKAEPYSLEGDVKEDPGVGYQIFTKGEPYQITHTKVG